MRLTINIIICLVFITLICCKQANTVKETRTTDSIFHDSIKIQLDRIVPKLLIKYHAHAAGVGIIKNGEIEFINVYGEHQKGKKAPKNTIFNVASITKPVVAMAVLKLVENGDWNLDEPLYNYWVDPEIKNNSLHLLLTTRHCLSHQTGFKNWRWLGENGKLSFDFTPGTKFQYSGEGMEYLRKAIENKFNLGLNKIVDSLIFKPFKMHDAKMGWLEDKDTARFAKWYDTQGNLHNANYKLEKINAADDMLLSIEDLTKFGAATMDMSILGDSIYNEMVTPQTSINQKISQGLGWVVYEKLENKELILNHDGGDPGVSTTMILFPKSKNGIILFVNSDNGSSVCNEIIKQISPIGMQIIEGLHWDNKIPVVKDISLEKISNFTGTYKTNHNFNLTFSIINEEFFVESEKFPKLKLYSKSFNEFFPLPFEIYFKFFTENGKKMVQLITSTGKVDLEGVYIN